MPDKSGINQEAGKKLDQHLNKLECHPTDFERLQKNLQFYKNKALETSQVLRLTQERLDLALWGANEAMWEWDIDTGRIFIHRKWLRMLDNLPYNQPDFLDLDTFLNILHPQDRDKVAINILAHIKDEVPCFEAEYRAQLKDGKWVWLLAKGKVVHRDKTGWAHSMLGTIQDITNSKNEEQQKGTILSSMSEILVYLDNDRTILWANQAASTALGLDAKMLIGQKCYNLWHGKILACDDCPLTWSLETGMPNTGSSVTPEGRSFFIRCYPVKDENESIIGVVEVAEEVTEQRKAQEAVIASHNKYQNLFEKNPVGLMQVDAQGYIRDVNTRLIEILGFPNKEAIMQFNVFSSRLCYDLGLSAKFNQVLFEGESISGEEFFRFPWGKELWLEYSINSISDENHNIVEAIVACQDVTQRKENQLKVRFLSFHDSLTQLYNRAFFEEEVRRLDVPRQLPLSIAIGDVNGLKLVNDAFGHYEGDKLLITMADILRQTCRKEDIIARWGGDEFVILFPRTSYQDAVSICNRINQKCRDTNVTTVNLSISLGCASKEHSEQSLPEVLKQAENRMYMVKLKDGQKTKNSIISSLETKLYEKTHETREHAERMQKMAINFGRFIGLDRNELERLVMLARLHDIGKIGLSQEVLLKPTSLLEEEWKAIKEHPQIGYRIVKASLDLAPIAEEVLSHHEKWNGEGYPRGLKGTHIPRLARIISIIDAYDVMTHSRPYKKAIAHGEALKELRRHAGTQFDPELVLSFIAFFQQKAQQIKVENLYDFRPGQVK